MHILITGGAGFIGSHLCEHLVESGFDVTVVDNLASGYEANLKNVIDDIDFYIQDIESFDFTKLSEINSVVHLAAQVSVPISVDNFFSSSSGNLLGSLKVMDFCKSNNIPLVYASSSALYGNLDIGDDKNSSVDLLSPYAVDKYAMELYAKVAHQLYELSSIGLRFYNVYGPRQDPGNSYSGVISIFTDRLLSGKDITINGGYQSRDFVYVKDVINAIDRAIAITNKNIICEQVNVLTGQSISIDYLADMLINFLGVEVNKIYKELSIGDPRQSIGTTKKIQQVLGIDLGEMIPIKSGLQTTIEFLKN